MSSTPARILYIDDEQINLSNFTQAFGDKFTIFTAASAGEALKILDKEGEMALVITDQRMPGATGIELLTEIAFRYPDTIRMILTGYTEVHEIIDAINKGQVFRYIVKPWEEDELGLSINNAIEMYWLSRRNAELVEELEEKNTSLAGMNAELEERVASRTRELHDANQRLKRKNDRLLAANLKEQEMGRELARLNKELRERIKELDQALHNVRDLQRLLPICSYCNKIRDDKHSWHNLHNYMQKYSDYSFSHSICPDCYKMYVESQLQDKNPTAGEEKKK